MPDARSHPGPGPGLAAPGHGPAVTGRAQATTAYAREPNGQDQPIQYLPGALPQHQWGYPYRPMPAYPQPTFVPTPRRPGPRVPAWVWVLAATVVVLVAAVGLTLGMSGPPVSGPASGAAPAPVSSPAPQEKATADPIEDPADDAGQPAAEYGRPNTTSSGTFTGEVLIEHLNAALAAQDRQTFFEFVDGAAIEPLSLWWDNMAVLGWTGGAIGLTSTAGAYAEDQIVIDVRLGAAQAGAPVIPADSDHPDASLAYAPTGVYQATIDVTDDGAAGVIVDWGWAAAGAPWDLEPLYAVVTDHAVVAGYTDESQLVDEVAQAAEESAAWVVQTYQEATGVANAQSYLTFVSEHQGRFNDWFIEDTSGWYGDRAGTMFTQYRPLPAPGVAADIATGGPRSTAGGILTVGPHGLQYGQVAAQMVITHEFVHAIHTTNVPEPNSPGSLTMEGWATYLESEFAGGGQFAASGTYIGETVRSCARNNFNRQFPTQDDFTAVQSAECAYALSGTVYAYADEVGIDVFELADESLSSGQDLVTSAERIGSAPLDEQRWADWVLQNYG